MLRLEADELSLQGDDVALGAKMQVIAKLEAMLGIAGGDQGAGDGSRSGDDAATPTSAEFSVVFSA